MHLVKRFFIFCFVVQGCYAVAFGGRCIQLSAFLHVEFAYFSVGVMAFHRLLRVIHGMPCITDTEFEGETASILQHRLGAHFRGFQSYFAMLLCGKQAVRYMFSTAYISSASVPADLSKGDFSP